MSLGKSRQTPKAPLPLLRLPLPFFLLGHLFFLSLWPTWRPTVDLSVAYLEETSPPPLLPQVFIMLRLRILFFSSLLFSFPPSPIHKGALGPQSSPIPPLRFLPGNHCNSIFPPPFSPTAPFPLPPPPPPQSSPRAGAKNGRMMFILPSQIFRRVTGSRPSAHLYSRAGLSREFL